LVYHALAVTISDELQQFLQQRLASTEQVGIVLLLKNDPSRAWTAPEVARQLGSAPESAAMRLFLLASSGLIAFDASGGLPRYRYAPLDATAAARLDELAAIHESDPDAVPRFLGAPPADPLRSFADAFKLKR
jgi:hypothetical protein